VNSMTDEEVVAWFFDTSERTREQVAGWGEVTTGVVRDLFIAVKSADPEVVEAIRAVRSQTEKLEADMIGNAP
jgi:hypothetical protein